jgi:type II secretory pathway pseudopilin PulG
MSIRGIRLGGVIVIVGVLSFAAGTLAQGRYGHINQAEAALRSALYQLQIARNVFGGHKRYAEGLINQAIGQLEAGKQFAFSRGY